MHIIVSGRVQGVCFRDHTRRFAQSLGLQGQVRNRPDGTVEILAQGPSDKLENLVAWCWQGSPGSKVPSVQSRELSVDKPLPPFHIAY